MTIYFAGGAHYEFLRNRPILESFWYRRNAERAMMNTHDFFLDSGAFTAFTQKVEINVDEYAEFIHLNADRITVASSLDAIGDPEKSYELYRTLKAKGCNVIPVFHCREDEQWLERYLDEGATYIALGGMVPESTPWKLQWLDNLWANYLTDNKGVPRVKVHGFGLTVGTLIQRYPWWSVDSTTWLAGSRFGVAIMNFPGRQLVQVAITQRHPANKKLNGTHIDRLPPQERAEAEKLMALGGVTLEGLQQSNDVLLQFNAWAFTQWEQQYGFPKIFTGVRSEGLF